MSKQAFKRVRRSLKLAVNRDPLPSFAWPGGYPLYYLFRGGEPCCPGCANDNIHMIGPAVNDPRDDWRLVAYDVNWEDTDKNCYICHKVIKSAYGEVPF